MIAKKNRSLLNQSGFTLVEILAAFSIFTIIVAAQTSLWFSAKKALLTVESKGQKDLMKNRFVQDVHSQVNGYQINFQTSVEAEADLEFDRLSMAWNTNDVYLAEECPACAGRAGFIVQPFELPGNEVTYRGVYRMVLKIYHKDFFPEGVNQEFLFTGK
ncbi:MAG: PilW family protein [Pseudobdellovibrionaceae bacterium]